MIFAGVRLPDEIRIALDQGKLVIFAGAGISMPPPSNLPSFNGLAGQICGLSSVQPGKEDQMLGKMAHNGTDVHLAAAKIVYHPNTRPTDVHKQILRVFGEADKVRIVTTNFDDHFSAAARSIFRKGSVTEFHAPALPLGDDFRGVVYLHGSARVNPRAMVLTDKNFGTAYLTRGWARDFLISLFSEYTVLFVGYSHNDVTTTYLARGLNQAQVKPRWALVSSDLKPEAEAHWARLEIEVQQYPIDRANTENAHHALPGFFVGWAKHTRESLLHRSKRMKIIAAGLPPENETVSEYLDYCLRHPHLAHDFCNAIRHPAWIGWMNAKGYFKAFFADSKEDLETHERVVAHWLSTFVRRKYPELLLEIIHGQRQRLARSFTQLLGEAVRVDDKKSPDPNFSVWVSLLLSQGDKALPQEMWAYLLQNCRIPENAGVALRLLELLTTPQIHLRKHFDFSGIVNGNKEKKPSATSPKKVDYEIIWPEGSKHWLDEAWKNVFKPNLSLLADPLSLLATKQLTLAHMLLRGVGKPGDSFDSLSWQRSSITPHEQNCDASHECLSLLIDVARELLIHWCDANPRRARAQIETWWSSNLPLLRRLAAYGVGVDPKLCADERLEWLLKNDLIFHEGMKKEVFDILAVAYPRSSESARGKLLRRIAREDNSRLRKKLNAETIAYEQFNVLVWLRRADKKCPLVSAAIAKIQGLYPQFREREHPDFDTWLGKPTLVDANEGFDFDQILSEPPGHYLAELRKAADSSMRRDRRSHLDNLKTLFSRNKEWGKSFMEALAKEDDSTKEIWSSVFWAWREAVKSNEDWEWILGVMEKLPQVHAVFAGVAGLISNGIFKQESKSSGSIIAKAASLMDKAWDICSKMEEAPDDSFHEWLTSAINHEGGCIGEFWVHYCSHLRQRAGEQWEGIPPALKSKMQEAVKGTSRIKVYARIAMTPWMGYIFAWDKKFALDNFLPLLDWKRDAVVAQQTWSVLLNYRRGTSVEMEQQLLPYYRQVADRMTVMLKDATEKTDQFELDDHATRNLGHYLAGVSMKVIENPLESGFFREFLPRLPEKVRGSLAYGIGNCLEATPPDKARGIWNKWLKEYLDLRLIGVPVALSIDETKAMADWCLSLGDAFPEAVQRIVQMPLKGIFAHGILDKLLRNSVLATFPKESCSYVVAVLKGEDYPFLSEQHSQLHGKFKEAISGTSELRSFEELLYLRGWKK